MKGLSNVSDNVKKSKTPKQTKSHQNPHHKTQGCEILQILAQLETVVAASVIYSEHIPQLECFIWNGLSDSLILKLQFLLHEYLSDRNLYKDWSK